MNEEKPVVNGERPAGVELEVERREAGSERPTGRPVVNGERPRPERGTVQGCQLVN